VAADTTLTAKSDTAAYFVLDTVNKKLYFYKISSTPKWNEISGSGGGGSGTVTSITGGTGLTGGTITTSGTLAADTNFLVTRFDTASMLTNYWRAGRFSGVLPLLNGGTGASVRTFVDTINTQTVNGAKTFTSAVTANAINVNSSGQSRIFSTYHDSGSDGRNIFIGGGGLSSIKGIGRTDFGSYNTSLGVLSLLNNTTGYANVAIGHRALEANTSGYVNTAIGGSAMVKNTTGIYNFALGVESMRENTSGSDNIGIGVASLILNTSGYGNIGIGTSSLQDNTTGTYNLAIGYEAGKTTTGSNNVAIGYNALQESAGTSNHITLGNSSISKLRCQVDVTTFSDARDKEDILALNYGMDFIDKLKPVSFVWNMRDGGKIGIPEIGFIAQDLQQAQIDMGINIPNLVDGVDNKLDVTLNTLLPIIVKALQEANEKINKLEKRIINIENK
jgi:hypothetical protein